MIKLGNDKWLVLMRSLCSSFLETFSSEIWSNNTRRKLLYCKNERERERESESICFFSSHLGKCSNNKFYLMEFEVLMAANIKNTVFWDVMPCTSIENLLSPTVGKRNEPGGEEVVICIWNG